MKNKGSHFRKQSASGARGRVFASWDFAEHGVAWQNNSWFKWAVILAILLLIYSIVTFNFLFAVIIILAGIIFYFQSLEKPKRIRCEIAEDGIMIGSKLYDYRDLNNFWIIYEPPEIKNLYLEFKNPIKPRLGISLESQNPLIVRDALKQYLEENTEREHEPLSDGLARWFKLHH